MCTSRGRLASWCSGWGYCDAIARSGNMVGSARRGESGAVCASRSAPGERRGRRDGFRQNKGATQVGVIRGRGGDAQARRNERTPVQTRVMDSLHDVDRHVKDSHVIRHRAGADARWVFGGGLLLRWHRSLEHRQLLRVDMDPVNSPPYGANSIAWWRSASC